ncbi:hypothetical protein OF829_09705 [Sphingomonas sp. LB-2]|uniref:hypothetical protein n=1 Tax=Sphingomonas caeni TaxID=2984949 RepID=UPI00223120BE|nr:hypothetical protein [Sphingomonas caeni]MCW3847517.1 hypothetical protein [Sphingomonas caeni]
MSHEHEDHETLWLPELHADVVELDGQIIHSLKEEMSDKEQKALTALIDKRNEVYKANHKAWQDEGETEAG